MMAVLTQIKSKTDEQTDRQTDRWTDRLNDNNTYMQCIVAMTAIKPGAVLAFPFWETNKWVPHSDGDTSRIQKFFVHV